MRCRTARTWIVAARDGELDARRRRALDRHLGRCERCRSEQVSIEGVLAALDGLSLTAEVPARLEADVLRQVRGLAADAEVERSAAGTWVRRIAPALGATAVVALALVGVRSPEAPPPASDPLPRVVAPAVARSENPVVARRSRAKVPVDPPAELASRPDLFVDLPMLREMDKLQHFDAIAAMDEGDGAPPGAGGVPSNG
jgi:anti-sigma factor RsiW